MLFRTVAQEDTTEYIKIGYLVAKTALFYRIPSTTAQVSNWKLAIGRGEK